MPLKIYQDFIPWCHAPCAQLFFNIKIQKLFWKSCIHTLLFFSFFISNKCISQNNTSKDQLNEITVKSIYPNSKSYSFSSSNYIDTEEIQRSGGLSPHEIISEGSNINLYSFSNNGKSTQLNIRGSGATSTSTILVLLDGMKLNTNDLGITDLSIINMDKIKGIEIIRGSSNVRYGGGASQGVINLLSKDIKNMNSSSLKIEMGSNDLKNSYIQSNYGVDNKKLLVYGKQSSNEGDRQHNSNKSINLNIDYYQKIDTNIDIQFKNRIHKDFYQYPGPLSGNQYRSNHDIKDDGSILAGQEGRLNERANQLKLKTQLQKNIIIENNTFFRDYKNTFIFGETLLNSTNDRHDIIGQNTLANETLIHWENINEKYDLKFGLEFNNHEYYRTSGGSKTVNSYRHNGDLFSKSSFFSFEIQPTNNTQFYIGYRITKSQFDYRKYIFSPNEASEECIIQTFNNISWREDCPLFLIENEKKYNLWRNESIEAKSFFKISEFIALATSIAKTFRLPNTDELALSNQSLKPQASQRYEANLQIYQSPLSYDLNLFYYETNNEILYQGFLNNGINFNANSLIKRKGGELNISYSPRENLNFIADIGYTDTKYNNNNLPLSPSISGSFNINWKIYKDLNLKININHTGEQFDGNDFFNFQYPVIDKVTLLNTTISNKTKISHKKYLFSFITIKNLLNENYISVAYSDTIYPGPSRSVIGGIKIEI